MAKEKDKSLTLEDILWEYRAALRGVDSMDKNRDAVISLVFLKFARDKFARCREQVMRQFGDNPASLENPAFYNAENVFYLKETARWDYIVRRAGQNDIAIVIDKAMADIEADNEMLAGALPDNARYDTIVLGYPCWWGTMPQALFTFLEVADFSGKKILPFCTHEGSGVSGTDRKICALYKSAMVKRALALSGSVAQNKRKDAQSAVDKWYAALGL